MILKSPHKEEHFHANRNIHRTIVAQTGNGILLDMFDSIWNRGISIRSFAAYPIPDSQDNREQHLLLLDQIKTGNPDEAETAMVAHIREGLDNHVRWLHEERH